MRVIIAGTRHLSRAHYDIVERTMASLIEDGGWKVTEVVSGGARGADTLGERWAKEHGIPVEVFLADWEAHGRSAGPIRNRQMAEYASAGTGGGALVAFPATSGSMGTKSMIGLAEKAGLKIHVEPVNL